MQDNTINNIQASIIRRLHQRDELRFAEINAEKVPSDQFSYHLRQLIKHGLIEKTQDGAYRLSTIGRTRTLMMSPNGNRFIEQGFIAVRIVLTEVKGDQIHYLMQHRAYVPYKGTLATPGNKILFGEDVCESAKRIMEQETGLTCTMHLRGLIHIKDKYGTKIVQDKYFFVLRATDPAGELLSVSSKGAYMWMTRDEVEASGRSAPFGLNILEIAMGTSFQFQEATAVITDY